MPTEARFRPALRRLLEEIMSGAPEHVADVNTARIEKATGVSRQVVRNWINADVDDPEAWFQRYDPDIEYRLKIFFSELLERDVEVIERVEIEASPRFQETAHAAVAA